MFTSHTILRQAHIINVLKIILKNYKGCGMHVYATQYGFWGTYTMTVVYRYPGYDPGYYPGYF